MQFRESDQRDGREKKGVLARKKEEERESGKKKQRRKKGEGRHKRIHDETEKCIETLSSSFTACYINRAFSPCVVIEAGHKKPRLSGWNIFSFFLPSLFFPSFFFSPAPSSSSSSSSFFGLCPSSFFFKCSVKNRVSPGENGAARRNEETSKNGRETGGTFDWSGPCSFNREL